MHHPCFDKGLIYKKSSDLFFFLVLFYIILLERMNEQNWIFFLLKCNKLDQIAGRILPVTSQKLFRVGKHPQNKKSIKKGQARKRKKEIVIFHRLCFMTVCRSSLFAEALFSPCTIFYAFGGKIPFSKILLIKKEICP